jgi:hypothetical protein
LTIGEQSEVLARSGRDPCTVEAQWQRGCRYSAHYRARHNRKPRQVPVPMATKVNLLRSSPLPPEAKAEGLARLTADTLDYAKEVEGSFPA